MPVEATFISKFSGGEVDYISSLEFGENQWSRLWGFVFDKQERLRTQWAGATWSAGVGDES